MVMSNISDPLNTRSIEKYVLVASASVLIEYHKEIIPLFYIHSDGFSGLKSSKMYNNCYPPELVDFV